MEYQNITISGKICTGTTTLAKNLERVLGWKRMEGGEIIWGTRKRLGLSEEQTGLRPDEEDLRFDEEVKRLLKTQKHNIFESHLAGFDAQGIPGVFKILLVCEDEKGKDWTAIRIDRMVNRNGVTIEEAKAHLKEREEDDLKKWRRLYEKGDPAWDPYNPAYYDLVINTYDHNQEETLKIALEGIGYKK